MTDEAQESVVVDGEGKPVDVAAAIANDGKLPTEEKEVVREEWLPEKFKTKEDLLKSYSELEKTLKEKGKVAPDEYTLGEEVQIDKEDEAFKGFVDVAKELKLSNDQFNKMIEFSVASGLVTPPPDPVKEKAELGADADVILDSLDRFAQTKLTEEERETLAAWACTAKEVKLLNKIVRMSDRGVPVKVGEASKEGKQDLQKKLNNLLSDPNIRGNREKQQEAIELSQRIASSNS